MRKITYPIFLFLFMISCGGSSNYGTSLLGPGETSILETVKDETIRDHISDMIADGWMELVLPSSDMDACYDYSNEKGTIDNYLDVKVGDGTDISVRLIEIGTNKCVRYVYVRKNDSFRIPNIPEGKYYLKIASGFDGLESILMESVMVNSWLIPCMRKDQIHWTSICLLI